MLLYFRSLSSSTSVWYFWMRYLFHGIGRIKSFSQKTIRKPWLKHGGFFIYLKKRRTLFQYHPVLEPSESASKATYGREPGCRAVPCKWSKTRKVTLPPLRPKHLTWYIKINSFECWDSGTRSVCKSLQKPTCREHFSFKHIPPRQHLNSSGLSFQIKKLGDQKKAGENRSSKWSKLLELKFISLTNKIIVILGQITLT